MARLRTEEDGILKDETLELERINIYGTNDRRKPNSNTTFLAFCWDAMKDVTVRLLLLSGIISLILGVTLNSNPDLAWIDGFAITCAVVIVAGVTGFNDFEK
jgi:uncharacterized membrane protein